MFYQETTFTFQTHSDMDIFLRHIGHQVKLLRALAVFVPYYEIEHSKFATSLALLIHATNLHQMAFAEANNIDHSRFRVFRTFETRFADLAPVLVPVGWARGNVYAAIDIISFQMEGKKEDETLQDNNEVYRPKLRDMLQDHLGKT